MRTLIKSEKDVKAVIRDTCKELGIYYVMPIGTGYGRAGIPDFILCVQGRFVGVECKFGKNTPTALQEKELDAISLTHGLQYVVNERNLEAFIAELTSLAHMHPA